MKQHSGDRTSSVPDRGVDGRCGQHVNGAPREDGHSGENQPTPQTSYNRFVERGLGKNKKKINITKTKVTKTYNNKGKKINFKKCKKTNHTHNSSFKIDGLNLNITTNSTFQNDFIMKTITVSPKFSTVYEIISLMRNKIFSDKIFEKKTPLYPDVY